MKNKIKLFSLISALAIGATMSLTACGDNTVGEHDHVWGEPVITESTCHTEGKKTYSCEVEGCEQTKTEPIAKIAHSWDDGEVTKQAKCNEEGVKTYTCTSEGCEQTKTEPIEKTEHRYDDGQITRAPDFLINGIKTFTCLDCKEEKTQSVKAHADFSEQFYTALTEQNNWYYGYMTTFGAQMSEDDFVQITQMEGGVWKSGEIEIGKGYVCGDNAAIAYRFTQEMPEKIQTNVSISFSGEESTTRVKAYLIINGECIKTIEEDSNNWSKTEEAIDIAQGDTLCIVFKNAGEGKAGGNLTLTLTSPCVHVWDSGKITKAATCTEEGVKQYSCVSCDEKITETVEMIPHKYNNGEVTTEPTETSTGVRTYTCENCGNKKTEVIPATGSGKFEGADFAEDYELNESGEFAGWQVGVIDYQWSSETFDFTKISAHNENGDAYHSNDPWIDIKGDWMAVNGMMGFAYNFTSAANVKVQFNLHAVSENGKFSVRWAIKDKDGNIKNTDGKAQWYGDGHDIEFDQDITVVAGDVLYLLVNKDEGGDQNTFDLTLTNKDKQPAPEFEGANFYEDFSTEGNNGWVYGYASDYNWDNNNFTFNSLEKVSDEEWGGKSGIIIKRDWILSEWTEENQGNANAAIGYKVPAGQTKLDVAIKFDHAPDSVTEGESPTRYSVRLSVVGADGNTKSVEFINKGTS
ncbi:MAG: hypothetical protein K2L12_07980, partial [Clostridia bacterium]|nr:hypothetical protein [Clostridia bacterium]